MYVYPFQITMKRNKLPPIQHRVGSVPTETETSEQKSSLAGQKWPLLRPVQPSWTRGGPSDSGASRQSDTLTEVERPQLLPALPANPANVPREDGDSGTTNFPYI